MPKVGPCVPRRVVLCLRNRPRPRRGRPIARSERLHALDFGLPLGAAIRAGRLVHTIRHRPALHRCVDAADHVVLRWRSRLAIADARAAGFRRAEHHRGSGGREEADQRLLVRASAGNGDGAATGLEKVPELGRRAPVVGPEGAGEGGGTGGLRVTLG